VVSMHLGDRPAQLAAANKVKIKLCSGFKCSAVECSSMWCSWDLDRHWLQSGPGCSAAESGVGCSRVLLSASMQ
jgi:hypothetical protein